MTLSWNPEIIFRTAIFAPLQRAFRDLSPEAWPDCEVLNAIAQQRLLCNAGGMQVRFVPQSARQQAFEDKYEPRTFLRGEIQMRAENWHDLFNALVWLTFPQAKAALNRRHYEALCAQRAAGSANRGPQQDALTLFDEGGIVVATADAQLADLLRGHAWKALFWQRRAELSGKMAFYVFGHALYEKALQPFDGITGRGVIFDCGADFFRQPADLQLGELDARLAQSLAEGGQFTATRKLAPVPILGIPGWCTANAAGSYYDNTDYFRPPPVSASACR